MAKNGFSMSNRVATEALDASSAAQTITLGAADCGKVYCVTDSTNNITLTLPAAGTAGAGWNITLMTSTDPTSTGGLSKLTAVDGGASKIFGGVSFIDASGSIGTEAATGADFFAADSNSEITFMSASKATGTEGKGLNGSILKITCISTDIWMAEGQFHVSGTTEQTTPFA